MSQKAGLTYGLGVSLAHLSYFVSVNASWGPAKENCLNHVRALQGEGLSLDSAKLDRVVSHVSGAGGIVTEISREEQRRRVEDARTHYRAEIHASGPDLGRVYDFGVAIGLGEGQASGDATNLALDAMQNARNIAGGSKEVWVVTPAEVPATSNHDEILHLRQAFQDKFTDSVLI